MPVNSIIQYGPSASAVILGQGTSTNIRFDNLEKALAQPQTQVRLFGKPEIDGRRRLGVVLTRRKTIDDSLQDAIESASKVNIVY
jgi:phosphoribosylglycinamide formyltransferase 2